MTINEPTEQQPDRLPPTLGTQASLLAALQHLADANPGLPAISWCVDPDLAPRVVGTVNGTSNALKACITYKETLGGAMSSGIVASARGDGTMVRSSSWYGEWDGIRFNFCGSDPLTDFDVFVTEHDADPQNWSREERAQYAALSAAAQPVTGVLA